MNLIFTLLFSLVIGINSFFQDTSTSQLSAVESSKIEREDFHEKLETQTAPCVIIVFGATGDLTARKLLPAIYNLVQEGNLSQNTAVVGFARSSHTHEAFRKLMSQAVDQFSRTQPKDVEFWNRFEKKLFYNQGDLQQDQSYENLQELLVKIDEECGTEGNRIFYFATQSSYFSTIIEKLKEHHLIYDASNSSEKWSKIVIEKPYGHDLESAIQLQKVVSSHLDESQVYRMDHYLGKEGVQNLFTLRFESGLFEPLWTNEHIDNVQITLSEDIGIGSRARFWEETGSLRDIFQNHLMQLLSIVAMEPPLQLTAFNIHEEKLRVLNAIRPFPFAEMNHYVVRGQYGPGTIRGFGVPGYNQEDGVTENSLAETFIAAKIFIDNPRWRGVPFYIRGGKRLPKQTTEIVVTFKNSNPLVEHGTNALIIRIQPNTGIFLQTVSKVPMLERKVKPVVFGFQPDSYFEKSSPEAYEKLFYDCIRGDNSLYVDAEEQLAAWRLLTPVLDYWKSHHDEKVPTYEAGTWGPSAADQMLEVNGHQWQ